MKYLLFLVSLAFCPTQITIAATLAKARTPSMQTEKKTVESLASGTKIRIDFRDASVLEIIRLLSELSGINIITSEKASIAKVSIFLKDMSVEAALDAVCKAAGLWYRKDEATGIWRVMTLEEYQRDIVVYRTEQTRVLTLRHSNVVSSANVIAALFGARVKLRAGVEESTSAGIGGATGSAPGTGGGQAAATAASIQAATAAAFTGASSGSGESQQLTSGQIAAILNKPGTEKELGEREGQLADTLKPPSIFVTYNRLHNLLIVRSSDLDALREIEQLAKELDRPTRQVLLEMKMLEVTLGEDFRSVFDFGLTDGSTVSPPQIGQSANPFAPGQARAPGLQLGLGNFPLEGGPLVFQFMNNRALLRIQLLASQNKVRVLATPMLLASNNQQARLFIGEERVLVTNVIANTVTNNNQTTTTLSGQTEKRNIGNSLIVLPRINADRTVTLSIQQDASSLLPKSTTIPVGSNGNIQEFPIDSVNTSNLQVTVIAKDRLAVAVGGMIRERSGDAETKVPLLGDIPILGNLFKRREKESVKTEMVLLITPYILDNPEEGEDRSRERLDLLMKQPNPLNSQLAPGPELPNPLPLPPATKSDQSSRSLTTRQKSGG